MLDIGRRPSQNVDRCQSTFKQRPALRRRRHALRAALQKTRTDRGEFILGIGAPKATPPEVIAILNAEINAGLANPEIRARMAHLDGMPLAGSPAQFGSLIVQETTKWSSVIKSAGLRAD